MSKIQLLRAFFRPIRRKIWHSCRHSVMCWPTNRGPGAALGGWQKGKVRPQRVSGERRNEAQQNAGPSAGQRVR